MYHAYSSIQFPRPVNSGNFEVIVTAGCVLLEEEKEAQGKRERNGCTRQIDASENQGRSISSLHLTLTSADIIDHHSSGVSKNRSRNVFAIMVSKQKTPYNPYTILIVVSRHEIRKKRSLCSFDS